MQSKCLSLVALFPIITIIGQISLITYDTELEKK